MFKITVPWPETHCAASPSCLLFMVLACLQQQAKFGTNQMPPQWQCDGERCEHVRYFYWLSLLSLFICLTMSKLYYWCDNSSSVFKQIQLCDNSSFFSSWSNLHMDRLFSKVERRFFVLTDDSRHAWHWWIAAVWLRNSTTK